MNAVEIIANKFQDLLGSKYIIIPMAKLQLEYTTVRQVDYGNNVEYVNSYNDKFTEISTKKTIGILNLQNPERANVDFYYITTNYTLEFRVLTNQAIIKDGEVESDFTFFSDIENLISNVINKKIEFATDYYGKLSVGEPTFIGKENDGENEFAIFRVSGSIVISDNANFGSEYKVEFKIGEEYVELDDINSYTENNENDNNAIINQGTTKVKQNLAQLGWVATISIDDKTSTNLARNLIYGIIHLNKEIINENAPNIRLERKQRVRITSPYGDIHLFDAIMNIGFRTSKNGVGTYVISLTDDNNKINSYTLSFDSDGGSEVESKYVETMAYIGELATPTKTGYTFKGWFVDGEEITSNYVWNFNENKTAIAQWEANEYTLVLNSNGGTEVEDITVTYGEEIGTIPTTTRDGYAFLNWTIDGEIIDENTIWNFTENKEAVANWEEQHFLYNDQFNDLSFATYLIQQASGDDTPKNRIKEIIFTNEEPRDYIGGFDIEATDSTGTTIKQDGEIKAYYLVDENNFYSFKIYSDKYIYLPEDSSLMFASCPNIETIELGEVRTMLVKNMYAMFSDCHALTNLQLEFNTLNVINMAQMFAGCNNLISLDINSFVINSGCNVNNMIFVNSLGNDNLQELKLPQSYQVALPIKTNSQLYDGETLIVDGISTTEIPLGYDGKILVIGE